MDPSTEPRNVTDHQAGRVPLGGWQLPRSPVPFLVTYRASQIENNVQEESLRIIPEMLGILVQIEKTKEKEPKERNARRQKTENTKKELQEREATTGAVVHSEQPLEQGEPSQLEEIFNEENFVKILSLETDLDKYEPLV